MKKSYIVVLVIIIAAIIAAIMVGTNTTNSQSADPEAGQPTSAEVGSTGDFNKLLESGSAEELKGIELGDDKKKVAEVLKAQPVKADDVSSSEEFDYYEHYELENGKKYDVYYKNGGVAGVTAFA